jgi:hypothetical protein
LFKDIVVAPSHLGIKAMVPESMKKSESRLHEDFMNPEKLKNCHHEAPMVTLIVENR